MMPTLVPHMIHCNEPRYTNTGLTDPPADTSTCSLVMLAHTMDTPVHNSHWGLPDSLTYAPSSPLSSLIPQPSEKATAYLLYKEGDRENKERSQECSSSHSRRALSSHLPSKDRDGLWVSWAVGFFEREWTTWEKNHQVEVLHVPPLKALGELVDLALFLGMVPLQYFIVNLYGIHLLPPITQIHQCDGNDSSTLLGAVDSSFLFAYAIAMYFREFNVYGVRGVILEKIKSSDVSAHSSNTDHIKEGFPWRDSPVTTEILAGIVQTTGWPGVVSVVGKWFGKEKRGLIFGIWNSHTSIGNILGSVIAGEFVETNWGVSFIAPGAIIAFGGFIIFLFLVENPSNVHCDLPTSGEDKRETSSLRWGEMIQRKLVQEKANQPMFQDADVFEASKLSSFFGPYTPCTLQASRSLCPTSDGPVPRHLARHSSSGISNSSLRQTIARKNEKGRGRIVTSPSHTPPLPREGVR
uniref:(California timema) hypothetical protein n=1 Tax=Timema californicum TaxID=61474 RepID=A0A7R9P9P2_TIMCA|nr:unnamed protein product [Timema californicum]